MIVFLVVFGLLIIWGIFNEEKLVRFERRMAKKLLRLVFHA